MLCIFRYPWNVTKRQKKANTIIRFWICNGPQGRKYGITDVGVGKKY